MRIALIGAGKVATALGTRWAAAGHELFLGVRDPSSPKVLDSVASIGKARATDIPSAVAACPVAVLCTPWPATQQVLAGAGDWQGKILIDCTNPLQDLSGLEIGHTDSGAERVARWAPGAAVFKAFNQTGFDNMGSQAGYPIKPVMFYCGDADDRRDAVRTLVLDAGFDAVDAGPLRVARYLEPLAMLWIHLAVNQHFGRNFAFALMRK